MLCCLNPRCSNPINSDASKVCQNCGEPLVLSLRGRYSPTKLLGQGGFGRTYLALDRDRLDAYCVIKQFSPQVEGTKSINKAIQLFNQEAVRLYELGEHPQIPALLAYFEQDEYLYLVQQYIEGQTLFQELNRSGSFGEAQIREILMALLPVLQFIHDHQVIHRDITPMNILRRKIDQRVMLIDFGVAKQLSESLPSQPGTRIGTEGYSPMEQFRGGQAYPASDIYSLGATCIHLLTHSKPDNLYSPLDGQWIWRDKMREQNREVSDGFAEILDRMLKDLVNDRYQSANDVLHDLKTLPSDMPSGEWQTSHASGGLHTPGAASPPSQVSTGQRPRSSAMPQTQPSRSGVSRPGQSRSGQVRSNAPSRSSQPRSSQPRSGQSRPGQSRPGTSRQGNSDMPVRQNGTYKSKYCRCVYSLTGHSSWVVSVAMNPVTPTFASSSLDNTIKVWNLQTGDLLTTLRGHTRAVNTLAFSPDGKLLASGSDDYTVRIWDVYASRLLRTLSGHTRDVTTVEISPDGQFLLSGGEDRAIRIWQTATGKHVKSPFGVSSMVRSLAVSPDNSLFASAGMDRRIRLWSMHTAERMLEFLAHMGAIQAIAISPNSKILASAGKDRAVRLWALPDGKAICTLSGHSRDVNAVAFTPDGRLLLSASSDKTIRIWDVATGKLIDTLLDHVDVIHSLAVRSDSKTFISGSADKTVKVWQMRFR
ncbi:MAG: serine/threonine-protein kinase [Elainellaceae cyanobacterium]